MSTRSNIAIATHVGIYSIYCHNDGYMSNNGRLLLSHWNNAADAGDLIALGNISSLGDSLDTTFAYGRDRGELDTAALNFTTRGTWLEEVAEEYNYLFVDGEWHCYTSNGDELVMKGDV